MTWFLKNAGDDDENGCVDCNDFFIGPMYAKWCHLVAKFGFNETTPVTDPIVWIRSISGNISLCVFFTLTREDRKHAIVSCNLATRRCCPCYSRGGRTGAEHD